MDWAHVPDLGWGRRPKLHGMQEVSIKSTITDAASETQAPKTSKAARRLSFLNAAKGRPGVG